MKKVTYPEELLLGRVQFSLQKGLLQLLLKQHVDYREEFLLGRSTLPTMTRLSIMRLALVWCIFLFATFFFRNPKLLFSQLHPPDHPLFPFKVKLLYQRDSSSSTSRKKCFKQHMLLKENCFVSIE